jgi:hypothetical protein
MFRWKPPGRPLPLPDLRLRPTTIGRGRHGATNLQPWCNIKATGLVLASARRAVDIQHPASGPVVAAIANLNQHLATHCSRSVLSVLVVVVRRVSPRSFHLPPVSLFWLAVSPLPTATSFTGPRRLFPTKIQSRRPLENKTLVTEQFAAVNLSLAN